MSGQLQAAQLTEMPLAAAPVAVAARMMSKQAQSHLKRSKASAAPQADRPAEASGFGAASRTGRYARLILRMPMDPVGIHTRRSALQCRNGDWTMITLRHRACWRGSCRMRAEAAYGRSVPAVQAVQVSGLENRYGFEHPRALTRRAVMRVAGGAAGRPDA
jgi:hypothetical protein